jgi:hypothetical protein
MDGGKQAVRWRTLAGIAAACVVVIVLAFVSFLDDAPTEGSTGSGNEPADAPTAATPAQLSEPVTTATSDPAGGLALIDRAHTMVFASDREQTAANAALVALYLRTPLVLVPDRATSSTSPTDPASEPRGRDGSEAAAEHADAAQAARRRGVVRAIVVGEGADAVARDSGARDLVRVPADLSSQADARAVIAAATESDQAPTPPDAAATSAASAAPEPDAMAELARYRLPAPPASDAALLVRPRAAEALAAVVSARAVGHAVLTTRADDLRADPEIGTRLARLGTDDAPPPLLLAGDAFADSDPDAIEAHAAVAMTGIELPGGGQLIFDPQRQAGRRYVGLYGVPQTPALGALGEQSVDRSVKRAQRLAREYRDVVEDDVDIIPCFEIIATVASSSAGDDRDFSNELPVADLREAVDAAGEAGIYVLLDLQPGRTDFVTQARRYRSLLREPHVGLALDPEWRLRPGERHLEQIGSVDIDEVNEVSEWLADLVERYRLPQKMFLLHQFRLSMLDGREDLDTSRDELAHVIQMDGQGPQSTKLETWRSVTADPPDGVQFGWKNFYDEDTPTRSPADTMALDPPPVFVSYQ